MQNWWWHVREAFPNKEVSLWVASRWDPSLLWRWCHGWRRWHSPHPFLQLVQEGFRSISECSSSVWDSWSWLWAICGLGAHKRSGCSFCDEFSRLGRRSSKQNSEQNKKIVKKTFKCTDTNTSSTYSTWPVFRHNNRNVYTTQISYLSYR